MVPIELGDEAKEVVCVCTTRTFAESIRDRNFAAVLTAADYSDENWQYIRWPLEVATILVLVQLDAQSSVASADEEIKVCLKLCRNITGSSDRPMTIALLLLPPLGHESSKYFADRASLQHLFMQVGIDDAVQLMVGQDRFTQKDLFNALLRTEHHARRLEEHIKLTEKNARKDAGYDFLWSLPEVVLASIPKQNDHVKEWVRSCDESGAKAESHGIGEYTFSVILGKGGFGEVIKAEHPVHGVVAIKAISKKSLRKARDLLSLDREICLMLHLPVSPRLVKGIEVIHSKDSFFLVMDFAGQRSLAKYLCWPTPSYETLAHFCLQVTEAVSHLHLAKTCHRDLKPDNFIVNEICVTRLPLLRLTDFGLATMVAGPGQLLRDTCGSLPFVAPEVVQARENGGYSGFAADVWSVGVVFLEVLNGLYSVQKALQWTRRAPVGDQLVKDLLSLPNVLTSFEPLHPKESSALLDIVPRMLVIKPCSRIEIETAHALTTRACTGEELVPRPPPKDIASTIGPRHMRTMKHFSSHGVVLRSLPADLLKQVTTIDKSAPLAERLGGTLVIHLALDRLFEKVLGDPLLAPLFQRCPSRTDSICSAMKCSLTRFLYPHLSEVHLDETRANLRNAHADLGILDLHFDAFLQHARGAFQSMGMNTLAVDDAVAKLASARDHVTCGSLARQFRCQANSKSKAWWASTSNRISDDSIRTFVQHLYEANCLPDEPSEYWHRDNLFAHIREFMNSPAAESGLDPTNAWMLTSTSLENITRNVIDGAMQANWPMDVTDLLFWNLWFQNQRIQVRAHLFETRFVRRSSKAQFAVFFSRVQARIQESRLIGTKMSKCMLPVRNLLADAEEPDLEALADAHQDSTINNSQFDVLINAFSEEAASLAVGGLGQSYTTVLSALRPWILRKNLQRQGVALMDTRSALLNLDWRDQWCGEFVAHLHDELNHDDLLSEFFPVRRLQRLCPLHAAFVTRLVAGTSSLEAERILALKHARWRITDAHFDRYMQAVRNAISSVITSLGPSTMSHLDAQKLLGRFEILKHRIVNDFAAADSNSLNKEVLHCPHECTDVVSLDVIIDAALRVIGKNPQFSAMCNNGQIAAPCRFLGLRYFLQARDIPHDQIEAMRAAHTRFHITSSQFSIIRSAFDTSMRQLGVNLAMTDAVRERFEVLEAPLTDDAARRLELAREQIVRCSAPGLDPFIPPASSELWREYSGLDEILSRAFQRFQEQLREEPALALFFAPAIHDGRREMCGLRWCLGLGMNKKCMTLDDPQTFDWATIAAMHVNMAVESHHVAEFTRCFRASLAESLAPAPVIDVMCALVQGWCAKIFPK